MDVKYSQKNPRTDSYYWTGTVLAMGHRDYVEEEARNERLQITQADGNVSFVPIIRREDPDLTDHEIISHILLNEDLVQQSARKKNQIGYVISARQCITLKFCRAGK